MKRLTVPIILLVFALYSAVIAYQPIMKINNPSDQHFVLQANRFLIFEFGLDPIRLPRGDVAEFFDKRFLYFGPFPSVMLVPFVAVFGYEFPQQILGPISLVAIFLISMLIAKKFRFKTEDQLWLAIFVVFSTALLAVGIIPISAYQVQAIGMVLTIVGLLEYFTRRRLFLVGICIAFAGMTRFTLYAAVIFFILEFVLRQINRRQLALFLIPILGSLLLLGAYNYKRFRSPFESGYKYNATHSGYPLSANLRYGLFNLKYVPTNLYSMLIKSPAPVLEDKGGFVLKSPYLKMDGWGIAIWFTSPLLLTLILNIKKNKLALSAGVATFALALPSLLFFSVDYSQVGYRYALDFLPFLYLLLSNSLSPSLGVNHKILIIIGVVFNALMIASIWGVYPLLGIFP